MSLSKEATKRANFWFPTGELPKPASCHALANELYRLKVCCLVTLILNVEQQLINY